MAEKRQQKKDIVLPYALVQKQTPSWDRQTRNIFQPVMLKGRT